MAGEVRLFIASPAYSGTFCADFAQSLFETAKDLQRNGIKTIYQSVNGVHWIDIARDILAHIFLHTDCTHMLQIDADIGWSADAVRQLLAHDRDVVGGAYPVKSDLARIYPVTLTGKEESGLLEADGLPGGFMLVKREVIERMTAARKAYKCAALPWGAMKVAPLYTRDMQEDGYTGEDIMFCRRAKEAGFSAWLDPDISFTHTGVKTWSGKYKE